MCVYRFYSPDPIFHKGHGDINQYNPFPRVRLYEPFEPRKIMSKRFLLFSITIT